MCAGTTSIPSTDPRSSSGPPRYVHYSYVGVGSKGWLGILNKGEHQLNGGNPPRRRSNGSNRERTGPSKRLRPKMASAKCHLFVMKSEWTLSLRWSRSRVQNQQPRFNGRFPLFMISGQGRLHSRLPSVARAAKPEIRSGGNRLVAVSG